MRRLRSLLGRVETAVELLCALDLAFLVGLTAVDVAGRYLLNAPVTGAYQMVQLGMAALLFAALPLVTVRRGHLTMGLFESRWTDRGRHLRDGLVNLAVAACAAVWCWAMYFQAWFFGLNGEVLDVIFVPLSPVAWLMAGTTAAAALAALALGVRDLAQGLSRC